MSYEYKYPRPAVTTDVVLLSREGEGPWHVLLIERRNEPFQDHWALPGGFLDEDEDPCTGAARELEEETGVVGVNLSPLGFWGTPGRDPRGHTISLVFAALVVGKRPPAQAADDAKNLAWYPVNELPALAFDHADIVERAKSKLLSIA